MTDLLGAVSPLLAEGVAVTLDDARGRLGDHDDPRLEVLDLDVAADTMFVRYELHYTERAIERARLGYSIVETADGEIQRVTNFLGRVHDGEAIAAPVPPPLPAVAPAPPTVERRWVRRAVIAGALVLAAVADEMVLGLPVIGLTAALGGRAALLALVPLYFSLSFGLSLVALRILRRDHRALGRFATWVAAGAHRGATRRLLRAGGVVGFLAASAWLSAPPTVWALRGIL